MSRVRVGALNVGETISSRYSILGPIGQGGMQDVYLANDELLGVRVALKTPLAGQPDKSFRKSAQIAARVNHYNVAKTLDYVEEGGRLFLVEEYVEGEDLGKKLNKFGILDPHLGVKVFLRLAKGVAASHHAGVVHCDLKPSNVIVGGECNFDILKITDFGVASLVEEIFNKGRDSEGDITLSMSGTVKGALPYMAPEIMFNSDGSPPRRASDIWSLGAMMFHVLTGFYPFGRGLEAAARVKNQDRAEWPGFMLAKPQYKVVSEGLQSLIDACLCHEESSRPEADDIVSRLADFCFVDAERMLGRVNNFIYNKDSGFIHGEDGGKFFFHKDSVYGPDSVVLAPGAHVCYSCFPGSPRHRAHPVLLLKK
jgi:histidine kinase